MQEVTKMIQPYDASTNAASAFRLWQGTVGHVWPLAFQRFQQILAAPRTRHFVIKEHTEVIAFVGTQCTQSWGTTAGHLLAVLVTPARQRQGLGHALCEAAFQHMREQGVQTVQLGGLSPRFWCGVPENLEQALPFFQKQGWESFEPAYDLTLDLSQYTTAPVIYQRMAEQQVTLAPARLEDMAEMLAFEEREYPNWLMLFQDSNRFGDYQDVFIARDRDGQVVGTLNTKNAHSHAERTEVLWNQLLGEQMGALGAVGVAAAAQGRGIGIALCAKASNVLKERGVGICYIDWVKERTTHFYGKLGYAKWRSYHTSWRRL